MAIDDVLLHETVEVPGPTVGAPMQDEKPMGPLMLAGTTGDTSVVNLQDLIFDSVRKTGRCVVVEEGWPVSSIGATLASEIMTRAFDWLDAPVLKVTGKDVPMPYAANLEKLALVTTTSAVVPQATPWGVWGFRAAPN